MPPCERPISMTGPVTFRLLSESHDLNECGWDPPTVSRLWRYNLHYFDDLNAVSASERRGWHEPLVRRWISENPVGQGTGWEPYPVSLRMVNWAKWILAGHAPSSEMLTSLAVQARWLASRLEWHLLGNHLLANAKALIFSGLLFAGAEPDSWRDLGMRVLMREVGEQVLPDGGHFELSPMYHAIVLEDLLDLVNAGAAFPDAFDSAQRVWLGKLPTVIDRMRSWLAAMCHPDGEISFFNDAALGIASHPVLIQDYAARLGLGVACQAPDGVVNLVDSGFVRVAIGDCVAILDVGRVGPHHLPAHAHADTLSFEMSLRGRRVLVNSGTSLYDAGAERSRQRATESHNTVSVDGCSSSEVWASFRVGSKARPFALRIDRHCNAIAVTCAHDGYRRLRPAVTHSRAWWFQPGRVAVIDKLNCIGRATSHWHWHPDMQVVSATPCDASNDSFAARLSMSGVDVSFHAKHASAVRVNGSWHPAFGVSVAAPVFACRLQGEESESEILWS